MKYPVNDIVSIDFKGGDPNDSDIITDGIVYKLEEKLKNA